MEADHDKRKAMEREHAIMLSALQAIAVGDGIYGQQAGEYKSIARTALVNSNNTWPGKK